MKTLHLAASVLATLICMPAFGATQGSPSSTSSTGSFSVTGNGPALTRTVQVLNISDVTFTNSTQSDLAGGNPNGVTMNFCAVDSVSGSMNLSITSTNGSNGSRLRLVASGGG